MAKKQYRIKIKGKTIVTWANSAEQAARRAEKKHAAGAKVINQKPRAISNRTRNMTNVKGHGTKSPKQRAAAARNLVKARAKRGK